MKIVLLYSGGLDSFIMYRYAKKVYPEANIKCLYWNHYHNAANSEINFLPKFVEIRNVDWLNKVNGYYSKHGDPSGPIYIPGRNLIFATLSACQVLPDEFWLGALLEEDHPGGTDKNKKFLTSTSKLLSYVLSPFHDSIKIRTPLVESNLTKFRAVEWALNNGITSNELMTTISCYQQEDSNQLQPCGNCKQCLRRHLIFYDLGFEESYMQDPILSIKNQTWINDLISEGIERNWPATLVNDVHWPAFLKLQNDNRYIDNDWINYIAYIIHQYKLIEKMI